MIDQHLQKQFKTQIKEYRVTIDALITLAAIASLEDAPLIH
jgi:hypothetical protein